METLAACPICETKGAQNVLVCTDYTVSKELFNIQECSNCGFWFTNPRPNETEIGAYYKSEEYISHTNSKKGLFNNVYQFVRGITIRSKFNLVNSITHGKNLLDYGCGTGEFLNYCDNHGMTVTGFEPDPAARAVGKQSYQLNLLSEEDLFALPSSNFDVITLWHVLEHVHRLKETIGHLERMLRPDGALLVAVPNHTSLDAKLYGEHWAAYDVPRHIYHFQPNDIRHLFSQFNMEMVEALPMKLDSYYVSMLSERYKKGNVVRAMLNGLRSNLSASSEALTWSSQIYILKKKR